MDDLEAIKDKVRFIFNGYKSTDPAMEVYEIEGELILGLPHEIGYKILDHAPDSFIARAEISHEYFELLLEANSARRPQWLQCSRKRTSIGR
jgi:hypothetical protein